MLSNISTLHMVDIMTSKHLTSGDVVSVRCGNGRWLNGRVAYCEPDTWPLVRLSDGQLTEVRPFMHWRLLQGALDMAGKRSVSAAGGAAIRLPG